LGTSAGPVRPILTVFGHRIEASCCSQPAQPRYAIICNVTVGAAFRWTTALSVSLLALWGADPTQTQREEFLFLLNPPPGSKGAAVVVLWIPPPLLRYCLGKTREQCVAIDYCIRTTNRNVSQCRNLTVDVTNIPKYPRDIYPRRVLAVTYFPAAASVIKGLDGLLEYLDAQPKADFDRLSGKARIKAKIKVTRSADDDDFDLLEVLAVPPL